MGRTIRVQPISGKFCSVTSHGNTIRIWLVEPGTKNQGTEVSIEDAYELLSLRKPVVCEAQIVGKDGKFIKQLTDEDWKIINEKKQNNLKRFNENTLHANESKSSGSDPALQKLVETQAKLIDAQSKQLDAQTKQLETMQKGFEEMQKNMEKLMKKGAKEK